jgi:hypothetical protein
MYLSICVNLSQNRLISCSKVFRSFSGYFSEFYLLILQERHCLGTRGCCQYRYFCRYIGIVIGECVNYCIFLKKA